MERSFIDRLVILRSRIEDFAKYLIVNEFPDVKLENTTYNNSGDVWLHVSLQKTKEQLVAEKLMEDPAPPSFVGSRYIKPGVYTQEMDLVDYLDQFHKQGDKPHGQDSTRDCVHVAVPELP